MKNFFRMALLIFIISCNEGKKQEDINCKYPGGIIYEKSDFREIDGSVFYKIKYRGQIESVAAYEIDSNYKVGDTINKKCR